MEVVTFPDSPFRLHRSFLPAGDQPQAIDKLIEGLSDGGVAAGLPRGVAPRVGGQTGRGSARAG